MRDAPETPDGPFGPECEPDWLRAVTTVTGWARVRGQQRWVRVLCGHCKHTLSEMRAQESYDGLQVEVRQWKVGSKGECTSAHGGANVTFGMDGKTFLRPTSSGWHWTCRRCPEGGARRLGVTHQQFVAALVAADASGAKRPAVLLRGGQAQSSV